MTRPPLRGPETAAAAVAAVLANPPSSIRDPILTGRPRDTATSRHHDITTSRHRPQPAPVAQKR
jgi:hypothetical protein